MSDQRNPVHRIVCGCDAGPACLLWDVSLNAEVAVRALVGHERDEARGLARRELDRSLDEYYAEREYRPYGGL